MLKLTVVLSAALYALLVIFSDAQGPLGPSEPVDVARAEIAEPARLIDADTPDPDATAAGQLGTADGRTLTITAHINPAETSADDSTVMLISTRSMASDAPDTISASASVAATLPVVEVTGSSVNLRAGPSTSNDVLTALQRGRQAELIEVLDNGWAQIRVLDTGVEGFMAERFLAEVN